MSPSRIYRGLRVVVLGLLLWLSPEAWADPEESFREGIRAGDLKKWSEAAQRMQDAITDNPQESQERIVLSGVFSAPYLPHFYRGWFLYQESRDHCEEALGEWEVSQRQGVVQKFKRQYDDLVKARGVCQGLVLPSVSASARSRLEAAEKRLSEVRGAAGPTTGEQLRPAAEKLAAARALLDKASAESSLSGIRQAERDARAAEKLLDELVVQAERQEASRLEKAVEQARDAVARAENALQDLEGAGLPVSDSSRRFTDSARRRLTAARELIETGRGLANLADVLRAREQARTLETEIVDARHGLDARVAAQEAVSEPAAEPPSPEPPAPTPVTHDEPSRVDPALVRELRRLREAAESFLALIGTESSSSELLELQRSRVSTLVLEAREHRPEATDQALGELLERLSGSLAALQLVAGAQAYFVGNPRQAIEILTAGELGDERLVAQGHLFLAASHYALFLIGVEDDLVTAADSVRKSSELDSDLRPDPRAFSPQFRQFFSEHAQNR